MSAYYLTMLTLNFAVFALAAVGIGAIYQLASGADDTTQARQGLRGRPVMLFAVLSIFNIGLCVVGAVLLTAAHDIVPGVDLGIDAILGAPITGVLVGLLTVVNVAVAVRAVMYALSTTSRAR